MTAFQNKKDKEERVLDMGRGCEFCGCGTDDVSVTVCGGCHKLHVTDWLQEYPDSIPSDIFEVRFKNTRRSYYRNVNGLSLKEGDIVAVEASPGHDIGIISLAGDMVARQMRRVGFNPQNGEFKKIYRKAKPYDIDKWQEAIALEHETMIRARQIAAEMNLNMKIGDVEYQGDKIKAIFYYIADERVDFRELIKVFAEVFHIRVEMKQIGARQEAGRIGGLGSCGRELCCASWISSFMSVTTNAARTQDISLNPQKLAGQCSKLKCCLMYEYDDYMDARREFPRVNAPLQVANGEYYFVKNDILARTMSFSATQGSLEGLVTIPIERVREVMKLNAKGIRPERLEGESRTTVAETDPGFVNVIGEDSITRFDKVRGGRRRNRNRGDRQQNNTAAENYGNNNNNGDTAAGKPEAQESRRGRNRNDRKAGDRTGENREQTAPKQPAQSENKTERQPADKNQNRRDNNASNGNNTSNRRNEGNRRGGERKPATDPVTGNAANGDGAAEKRPQPQNGELRERTDRPQNNNRGGNRRNEGNRREGGERTAEKPAAEASNAPRKGDEPRTENGQGGSRRSRQRQRNNQNQQSRERKEERRPEGTTGAGAARKEEA